MSFREYLETKLNEGPIDKGKTSVDGEVKHRHQFQVDTNGTGGTSEMNDHSHNIIEYEVKPSGEDEHIHKLGV